MGRFAPRELYSEFANLRSSAWVSSIAASAVLLAVWEVAGVPLFSRRVCAHLQILITGTPLTSARRTVAAVARLIGLAHAKPSHRCRRVRSPAK